jgi:hypothetical protein
LRPDHFGQPGGGRAVGLQRIGGRRRLIAELRNGTR